MATVVRENMGLLHDKLTVKIKKEHYLPTFEKKLKEYSKTANIPGFRKGMVPAGMIRKMYGSSIFSDEILRTVEKELYTYLNEEKPEIFAQPLPLPTDIAGMDINNPSDYDFDFEIGLKPAFEIPALDKAAITRHNVEVTDAMVDEELGRIQVKAGNMTDVDTITDPENVINVLFTESDKEGNAIEGGVSKENSVLLKYFSPALQQQLMGKKTGDHIVFQLSESFEADKLDMMLQDLGYEKGDKEAAAKYFKLDIVKIGLVVKKEMNEDFFNEVFPGKDLKTEDELRAALKQEIQQYWDAQSRNQVHDQLYHYLLDETKMEFPETFLKKWLQTGGEQQKSAEQAETEYPTFQGQLKWTLISDRLITENKLDVSEEELRASMQAEVMRYFGQMNMMGQDTSWLDSYIDRMMKDEKQVDATYRRLITEKLFNYAESKVKATEKTVSADELVAMQHNHQH